MNVTYKDDVDSRFFIDALHQTEEVSFYFSFAESFIK